MGGLLGLALCFYVSVEKLFGKDMPLVLHGFLR